MLLLHEYLNVNKIEERVTTSAKRRRLSDQEQLPETVHIYPTSCVDPLFASATDIELSRQQFFTGRPTTQ